MSNIYQAITAVMEEGYAISKSKRNQKQGYQYRGIDDVLNTFQPLLSKHKIFVVPDVLDQNREERQTQNGGVLIYAILKVRYSFYAADGSHVDAVVVGEGMDSGDKASNKAMSAALKYAMFQVFCIPTEEMIDSEIDSPEITPKPQKEPKDELHYRCAECGEILKPYKDNEGKEVPLRKHAARSEKLFGEVLCLECITKRGKKEKENADAE